MDLPFDKLPKFLAVAGLTLACAGASLLYTTYIKREQELSGLQDIEEPMQEHAEAMVFMQYPLVPAACQSTLSAATDPKEIACQRTQAEYQETLAKIHRNEQKNMGIALADAAEMQEKERIFWRKFKERNKIYRLQMILGGLGILIGSGISGFGFKGWWDLERNSMDKKQVGEKHPTRRK
jgi:hypothetical protein